MLVPCLQSKSDEIEASPLGSSLKSIGLMFYSSLSFPREKLLVGLFFSVMLRCAGLGERLSWLLWNGFFHLFTETVLDFELALGTVTS